MGATLQRDGEKQWRKKEKEEVKGNAGSKSSQVKKDGGINDENSKRKTNYKHITAFSYGM